MTETRRAIAKTWKEADQAAAAALVLPKEEGLRLITGLLLNDLPADGELEQTQKAGEAWRTESGFRANRNWFETVPKTCLTGDTAIKRGIINAGAKNGVPAAVAAGLALAQAGQLTQATSEKVRRAGIVACSLNLKGRILAGSLTQVWSGDLDDLVEFCYEETRVR